MSSIGSSMWMSTKANSRFMPPKHLKPMRNSPSSLRSKKNLYFLFATNDLLEESITLPSVIKNDATIITALKAKIRDDRALEDELVLHRFATTSDPTGESSTHFYQGLREKEILDAIIPLPHLHNLKRVSVERYALFALSEELYRGRSYLSVYTTPHRNIIIAGHKGELLFARTGEFTYQDDFERISEQVSDISRTVAYAKQQYRDVNLEFILIGGSMVDMSAAVAQVQSSIQTPVSLIAPSLIVQGLDKRHAQESILEIGTLFLPNHLSFLPDRVKAAHEFHLGSWVAIAVALVFMLYGVFMAYDASESYQESVEQHTLTESKLNQALRHTRTLEDKKIQEITAQLETLTPLHHAMIDDLIPLEEVLMVKKPHALSYQDTNGTGTLNLDFRYQSKNLMDLYLFEKEFKTKVAKIAQIEVTPAYKTDYSALTFESTLTILFPQEVKP
jgi:hypothetical protein